jgi:hypothetical protein
MVDVWSNSRNHGQVANLQHVSERSGIHVAQLPGNYAIGMFASCFSRKFLLPVFSAAKSQVLP